MSCFNVKTEFKTDNTKEKHEGRDNECIALCGLKNYMQARMRPYGYLFNFVYLNDINNVKCAACLEVKVPKRFVNFWDPRP